MDLNQSDWSNKLSLKESNVIIDVRTPEEFDEGFIKNAINLNIYESSDFVEKIKSFSKNNEYYIYCKSGGRSSAACKIMSQMGFNNVYNLMGGISEWNGEISS
jgi:rhodanese-related sulfurtransferase